MRKLFTLMVVCLAAMTTLRAEEIVAVDTLAYTATRVQDEPDPNNREYVFTLFGSADGKDYKTQIDYFADTMYGTFTDADFNLSGSGKNFNYIRTTDGSKMWSFKHLDVEVTNVNGDTHIALNGLVQNLGQWRRILITADIAAPAPTDTLDVDLGQVSVIPNTFLGYTLLEAANEEYALTFGLTGYSELKAGTYYRTELLRPDFVKLPSDTIQAERAQMVIADSTVAGLKNLYLDLISTSNRLYRIAMHTDTLSAKDTVDVACNQATLTNLESMYNIYQFVGANSQYQVALAVRPGVIRQSMLEIPADSVDLSYTQVLPAGGNLVRIQSASGRVEIDPEGIGRQTVYADLLGTNGTLYRVTFPFGGSNLPAAADTTMVDCGEYVGRLDFTKGPGWMGLVLGNNDVDVHVTVNNDMLMKGTFTSDCFNYEGSYITTYQDNDGVIRFSDVQLAELRMDSIGNKVRMELDVITITNKMYCFRATMPAMYALSELEVNYQAGMDVAQMVALRTGVNTYHMQVQRYDDVNDDGEIVGNAEIWDFCFKQEAIDGISGQYGIAAETLETTQQTIYENGTEILLNPMAAILTITAGDAITVEWPEGSNYQTHNYSIEARFATENLHIYNITGNNILICVDGETGDPVEFTETDISSIAQVLGKQGFAMKKVLRNGVILLEREGKSYNLQGQEER